MNPDRDDSDRDSNGFGRRKPPPRGRSPNRRWRRRAASRSGSSSSLSGTFGLGNRSASSGEEPRFRRRERPGSPDARTASREGALRPQPQRAEQQERAAPLHGLRMGRGPAVFVGRDPARAGRERELILPPDESPARSVRQEGRHRAPPPAAAARGRVGGRAGSPARAERGEDGNSAPPSGGGSEVSSTVSLPLSVEGGGERARGRERSRSPPARANEVERGREEWNRYPPVAAARQGWGAGQPRALQVVGRDRSPPRANEERGWGAGQPRALQVVGRDRSPPRANEERGWGGGRARANEERGWGGWPDERAGNAPAPAGGGRQGRDRSPPRPNEGGDWERGTEDEERSISPPPGWGGGRDRARARIERPRVANPNRPLDEAVFEGFGERERDLRANRLWMLLQERGDQDRLVRIAQGREEERIYREDPAEAEVRAIEEEVNRSEERQWKLLDATVFGEMELAHESLLDGADVNWRNPIDNWKTALHYAAQFDMREVAELLVGVGANVFLRDGSGARPADCWPRGPLQSKLSRDLGDPKWVANVRNQHRLHGEGGPLGPDGDQGPHRSLERIGEDFKARLQTLRGEGVGGQKGDMDALRGVKEVEAWKGLLTAFECLPHTIFRPSEEPKVNDLTQEGRNALISLRTSQNAVAEFHRLQATLKEKVAGAARLQLDVSPVSEREARQRDEKREKILKSLETALRRGSEALKQLASGGGSGVSGASEGCEIPPLGELANRFETHVDTLKGENDLPVVGLSRSLRKQSASLLCQAALSLSNEWQRKRESELAGKREACEKAAAALGESVDLTMDRFPAACRNLQKTVREEQVLVEEMNQLEDEFADSCSFDLFPLDQSVCTGKQVIEQVISAGWEVGRKVRRVSSVQLVLRAELEKAGAVARELRAGASLVHPEKLQAGRVKLKGLLETQREERRQIRMKDLDLMRTQVEMEVPSEELKEKLERIESELRVMKEKAAENDYPAAIARERACLLSLASLHFPELLWEGSDFLRLVRQDLRDVVPRGGLVSAGVLMHGRSFARDYRNIRVLSESSPQTGSLARVCSCEDLQGRKAVVKRYQLGTATHGTAAVRHFYRQVGMLHELQHPHLVPVVAVWQEGEYGFVQMPFYPGGDLAGWMKERPVAGRDAATSLRLAEDLLSALAFLHQKKKVHCDVKPQNVFLTEGGRGVLGDFDGVKAVRESKKPRATTILHVTAHYLAPEIRAGEAASHASDVFSAGVTLRELLGGGVLGERSMQRAEALNSLLARMTAESPDDRPTAAQVLQDPLFSSEVMENAQCVTCFEVILRDRGVSCGCPHRHFLCAECLNAHVQSQSMMDPEYADVRARFKQNDCRVSCVARACPSEPFAHSDLARHLTPDVLNLWEGVRREAAEERVRAEMETEFEGRLRMALREDGAQRRVREIAEEILTLKCPRCRAAFVDFDGCASLTCNRCYAAFCGYCLRDCGNDAHPHVRDCPMGRGVFVRWEVWEQIQKRRKYHQVTEFLGRLNEEERAEVEPLLEPLLRENGLIAD
uniref:non-specific serine/threonine protein kinase n=1 Tax=Chromera velia CCMP2878 TaxID=1169474 RepID=A0A0G4GW86_9ALVE|eukprot:Cvel_23640.t1-p1 / transcript=Cvel_23640.t1 / gene=Cvel_23640 / organism=Chromera_velia_CCMP2878 / gene_product=Serine/threonine-protein kinase StkP, putative / transcript_product=Serine/threonine-protein kinase StkP, putative / location=Cvel_scaffold2459:1014-7636(+) / protein_length=1526 / sequence_SO=supercontig / SO=protein_coding / is_pseudo=false